MPWHRRPQVLYLLTSGSEANDLAWRIARAAAAAADPDDSRPLHVAVVSAAGRVRGWGAHLPGEGVRCQQRWMRMQGLRSTCMWPTPLQFSSHSRWTMHTMGTPQLASTCRRTSSRAPAAAAAPPTFTCCPAPTVRPGGRVIRATAGAAPCAACMLWLRPGMVAAGEHACPPTNHPAAAVYRGQHLDGAAAARAAIAEAEAAGGRIAAFFSESILSCGGQVSALGCRVRQHVACVCTPAVKERPAACSSPAALPCRT